MLVAGGRTFVLSVTSSQRDTSTSLRTIASALPPTHLAGPGRSRDDIRAAIRRSLADVRLCYERGVATQRGLAGRVTASFIIDQAGDVQTASISSTTLAHPQVLDTVRLLRFGVRAEPGIVGVNYPFVFDTQP